MAALMRLRGKIELLPLTPVRLRPFQDELWWCDFGEFVRLEGRWRRFCLLRLLSVVEDCGISDEEGRKRFCEGEERVGRRFKKGETVLQKEGERKKGKFSEGRRKMETLLIRYL